MCLLLLPCWLSCKGPPTAGCAKGLEGPPTKLAAPARPWPLLPTLPRLTPAAWNRRISDDVSVVVLDLLPPDARWPDIVAGYAAAAGSGGGGGCCGGGAAAVQHEELPPGAAPPQIKYLVGERRLQGLMPVPARTLRPALSGPALSKPHRHTSPA